MIKVSRCCTKSRRRRDEQSIIDKNNITKKLFFAFRTLRKILPVVSYCWIDITKKIYLPFLSFIVGSAWVRWVITKLNLKNFLGDSTNEGLVCSIFAAEKTLQSEFFKLGREQQLDHYYARDTLYLLWQCPLNQ